MTTVSNESETLLQARWENYRKDPVAFAYEVAQVKKLDKWQEEVLMSLATNDLVAVAAGVGVGKDYLAAVTICWFLCVHPFAKVAAMSASAQQVQVSLWMEISRVISESEVLPHLLEWTPSVVKVRGYGERWRAFQSIAAKRISAVTGDAHAEAGQGLHADYLLVVISEASGVDDSHFDAKLATLTGGIRNVCFCIGNPQRRSGRFYEIFTKPSYKKYWVTRHVDQRESSFVNPESSQRLIDLHGEDSPIVQAKVHGMFPMIAEGKTIFGYDEVEQAFDRFCEDMPLLPIQIGVDVARYGDCETVILVRRGNLVLDIQTYKRLDLMSVAGMTVQAATMWWRQPFGNPNKFDLEPDAFLKCQDDTLIVVDEVGIGGGVIDALRSQGWTVSGINNGSKPRNPKHYASRGDELWFVDGKLAMDRISIPQRDEELQHQLCNREVRYARNGTQRRVETKDELLKRGLPSPDRADALLLAFATVTNQRMYDYSSSIRVM